MPENDTPATPETEQLADGGTPTPEEARLAAQIDTIGDNPEAEPEETAATDTEGAQSAADADADDGDRDDASSEEADAAEGEATKTPEEPDAPSKTDEAAVATPAAAPVAAAQPPDAPEPPRDFDAAYAENQKKFDDGEIDAPAFQQNLRAISREEAGYQARLEIYKERLQTAAQKAEADFAAAASAWEKKHAAFMANPLYANAMQQAIVAVDKQTPGLSPEDLLAAAEKAAFEFTRYTPPADTSAEDEAARKKKAVAEAKAKRKPNTVPTTLSNAPTAAHVDADVSNATYAKLDALDIDSLENQLARMKPDQVEAYLADAPGAQATGQ